MWVRTAGAGLSRLEAVSFTLTVIAVDMIGTYCRAFGFSVLCLCSCTGRM